jgi:hypothetical protein
MGVNSNIYLPGDVRVRDVGKVIGVLAGFKKRKIKLRHLSNDNSWYVDVEDVQIITHENVPSMCTIRLKGDIMIDGEDCHHTTYHFESDRGTDRFLYPIASPFWIAIGKRLCKFFGGKIDYADCDKGGINATWKSPRKNNSPDDGRPWQKFQEEIFNLEPITMKELKWANKWAAYKLDDIDSLQEEYERMKATLKRIEEKELA